MNNQNYIKAGVELADGWGVSNKWVSTPIKDIDRFNYKALPDVFKDALAAQLTEQVDALDNTDVDCHRDRTYLRVWDGLQRNEWEAIGPDRAMNTIKVVVDSKVLK